MHEQVQKGGTTHEQRISSDIAVVGGRSPGGCSSGGPRLDKGLTALLVRLSTKKYRYLSSTMIPQRGGDCPD